jgi:hypothetical protein
MLFLVVPPIVLKDPPIKILPSGWMVIEKTKESALGLNPVSSVPSLFSLAIRFLVVPPTVVKPPPIKILPSGCMAIE